MRAFLMLKVCMLFYIMLTDKRKIKTLSLQPLIYLYRQHEPKACNLAIIIKQKENVPQPICKHPPAIDPIVYVEGKF